MHDEARVAFFGIPLEAREVGSFANLVVGLLPDVSRLSKRRQQKGRYLEASRGKKTEAARGVETYLLLELLVDGV